MVAEGLVKVRHVSTAEMAAVILTECLPADKFKYCREKLGLC